MSAGLARELAGLGLVAAAVGAVFALAEVARRGAGWDVEHTRKLAHVGSGLVAAAFPWLFSSALTVGLCTGGFAALLVLSAGRGLLPSVHAVARRTSGHVFFPCGVALAFCLSARPAPFVAAVLALALGDAVAALVGRRYGRRRYRFGGSVRSVEGSGALFLATAAVVASTLRLLDRLPVGEALAWALAVGALATAIEASAQEGSDNLLLPLAVALALGPAAGPARGAALVLVAVAAMVLASLLDAVRQPGGARAPSPLLRARACPAPSRTSARAHL